MARDKIGAFIDAKECEQWLNRWSLNYVNVNVNANASSKQTLLDSNPKRNIAAEMRYLCKRIPKLLKNNILRQ